MRTVQGPSCAPTRSTCLREGQGWRSCVAVMVGEGGVFLTCAVVLGSKNERVVVMLANSPLGLRHCRLVNEYLLCV